MIAAVRLSSRTMQQTLSRSTFCTLRTFCGKRRIASISLIVSAEGPRELEPPDVRKLARLAQIRVTDEEVSKSLVFAMQRLTMLAAQLFIRF